jgi:hypothetical protein
MALDLTSVNAKLRRANEHLNSVHQEAVSRLQPQDYSASKQINANRTRFSWVFHAHKGTDFETLSLQFADCVHNLRCALDHLVYTIAIHESGNNPPPEANRLAFPLACNTAQFQDAKRSIKSLSLPVRTAIESVQPYNRPHPDFPPLLGLLGEFDNMDKHRLLRVTIGTFSKTSYGHRIPAGVPFQLRVNVSPLENGAEIAAFVFDNPMPEDVIGNFDGDFILGVNHAPSPGGNIGSEARTILAVMRNEVKAVIDIVVSEVK